MAKTTVTVDVGSGVNPFAVHTSWSKRRKLRLFANMLKQVAAGGGTFTATSGPTARGTHPSVRVGLTQASGTLTFSGASGTVGGSINGVAITVATGASDAATAAAWAAAVNASTNPLVSGLVTATATGGVASITSGLVGAVGNQTTLAASGTGVTASGARLTGGTSTILTF